MSNGKRHLVETPIGPVTMGELAAIFPSDAEHFALHCEHILSNRQRESLQQAWSRFMPGRKLLVVDGGMRLAACAADAPNASDQRRGEAASDATPCSARTAGDT